MSVTAARGDNPQTAEELLPAPVRRRQRGLRWWKEVLYVLAFYLVYSAIRNTQGSASVSAQHALHNALHVIRIEKAVGIFHEQAIQNAAISVGRFFIEFWNVFYGTFHFIVTAFALIYIFRRFPERYARWRNTLALTTALALVGFALYPLMPPRLLSLHGLHYGFVDTLERFEAFWSFDSGTMQKISNQYAAMPSLHFAWSLWCSLSLFPVLRRWWTKALAVLYPACTLFAIVVTANHYFLDAVGGAVCLGVGYLLAGLFTRRWAKQPAAEAAAAT
ncbi:MAG: phosphatase PAP2 family protein [Acidimicrobiia bacterium]|nr:phosphatase PAP2 family protein [Acidimicrobiia bacterium]